MQIKSKNYLFLWARSLAYYFSIYLLIMSSHLFFKKFNWWDTDVDSARYMLSALVQGEFAVVALVVTLSLVAVQLAAQSYSARVIEVFRRTPDLWILILVYGISIFYGLGVLKLIEKVNPQMNNLSDFEGYVSFAFYLGIFSFVALGPYIWNSFNLLKPSIVINMLMEKITKQEILLAIKEEKTDEPTNQINIDVEKDPILPIIDVVYGSLIKYDHETVEKGLKPKFDRFHSFLKKRSPPFI